MDQRREAQANEINGSQSNENDGVSSKGPALRLYPCVEQKAENYEDLEEELEFSPHLYSALERHLPSSVLSSSRDNKVQYMTDILLRYSPRADRSRVSIVLYFIYSLHAWNRCYIISLVRKRFSGSLLNNGRKTNQKKDSTFNRISHLQSDVITYIMG